MFPLLLLTSVGSRSCKDAKILRAVALRKTGIKNNMMMVSITSYSICIKSSISESCKYFAREKLPVHRKFPEYK
jgi:hypothetical protein